MSQLRSLPTREVGVPRCVAKAKAPHWSLLPVFTALGGNVYLLVSLEACPLAESVRELCWAMGEFVTITTWDILKGLEMDRPVDSCRPPLQPYSAGCWIPQLRGKRKLLSPLEFPRGVGCPGYGVEPPHSLQLNCLPAYQGLLPYQHFCPPEHWW